MRKPRCKLLSGKERQAMNFVTVDLMLGLHSGPK